MLDPSIEGKGERSKTVIFVLLYEGREVRAYAVERPKTPEPIMRIDFGISAIVRTQRSTVTVKRRLSARCRRCFDAMIKSGMGERLKFEAMTGSH